jgi:hypothetical protein
MSGACSSLRLRDSHDFEPAPSATLKAEHAGVMQIEGCLRRRGADAEPSQRDVSEKSPHCQRVRESISRKIIQRH